MSWLAKIGSGLGLAEKVVDKGVSILQSEVTRYRKVEEELERLRRTSDRINSLLTDAEERRYIEDKSVMDWLSDLKSVSFDTDDLLDEYQTAINVHNVEPSRKRKRNQFELPSISPEWGPLQRRRFSSEIDKIDNRLEEIRRSRNILRLNGEDGVRRGSSHLRARPFQTGPCHDQASIIGRENDKNEVVNLLITGQTSASASRSTITVVLIHGAAGIGKTTLARMVYNDPRLNCFNIKAWVCLTERCDVSTAMKKIYEKMTGQRCESGDFGRLQDRLGEYLQTREDNNKFLLVIDNFWAADLHFGDMLRVLLLAGGDGSKFLITTRNEKTCHYLPGVIERPSLKDLGEEECWELIQSLALPQSSINHDHEKLVIGKEIARRCYGSPMAAKALGAVLNGRSDEEWSDVLSDMRPLKDDINGAVRASLKISYHDLKYHLKKCFAYCSIFPNGYVFERDQVIRYWIAEGLIEPDGNRRLEAVGTKYFDELIWRSFFEKITIGTEGQNAKLFSGQVERYRMPSLMLDLAIEVSKYEFRSFESGKPLPKGNQGNSDQARYASFLQPENTNTVKLECLEPYSNLRTLKFCHELNDVVGLLNSIQAPFFRKFMHLRVLDMSNSDLKLVPDSVGELIHLRFLGLSNTQITTLPENICDLFNLQTLELKGCLKLEKLPEGLRWLINLRHLDLHLDWEVITDSTEVALPQGFDDLEQLQTLSRFNVTCANGPCNISELNKLNLRGDLCIMNLEKVPTGQAIYANLKGKLIEKLMLRWQSSVLNSNQLVQQQSEDVIKSLEPHHGLRCLWIVNYPGNNFPHWLGDPVFWKLEAIQISTCCNNFNFLPLLGQLRCLKNLLIGNLPVDTMSMPGEFPSLEHLKLLNLSSLKSLCLENEIPKLIQIYISDCPNLNRLDYHEDLHDKFQIENCPMLSIWE